MKNIRDNYLTVQQLSERLGVAVGTLNNWRSEGKGVPYVRLGRVLYPIEEVEKFEAELAKKAGYYGHTTA